MRSSIVLQGPLNEIVGTTMRSYEKYNPILVTEDVGVRIDCENVHYIQPIHFAGIGNINRQSNTTLYGLRLLKKNGIEFAFKMRTDLIFLNIDELLSKLENLYSDKIIFYTWHVDGYMVDYFMYGKVDDLIDFWEIGYPDGHFAEQILLNNYNKKHGVNISTFEDSRKYFDYCINNHIDFYWKKYNVTNKHYEFHKKTYLG